MREFMNKNKRYSKEFKTYNDWLKQRYGCDYCNKGFERIENKIKHQNKCLK